MTPVSSPMNITDITLRRITSIIAISTEYDISGTTDIQMISLGDVY